MVDGAPKIRNFDAQEIQQIYVIVMTELMNNHENKLLKKLNILLNDSFNYLDKNWKPGVSLMIPSDAHQF